MRINTSSQDERGNDSIELKKDSVNLSGSQNVRQFLNNINKSKRIKDNSRKSRQNENSVSNQKKHFKLSGHILSAGTETFNSKKDQNLIEKIKSDIFSIDDEINDLQNNIDSKLKAARALSPPS